MAPFIMMWFHLTAVAAWIGGMLFVTFAVRPAFGRKGASAQEETLRRRIENGFKTIRWLAIIAIIITGFYNLLYEGANARLESAWGAILLVKILLAGIAIALTGINDFILSQGSTPGWAGGGSRTSTLVNHAVLILAVFLLLMGVYLAGS
jgi:putative copper export protein